jgi:intracellular septation protein
MQQLIEMFPIVLFFLAYSANGSSVDVLGTQINFNGIYTATAVLMIATAVQVALTLLITRRVEKRLLLMFVVVMATGSLTLILQNKIFIQWKPTLFNGALAIAFVTAPLFGKRKTLLERTLGQQLTLPAIAWQRLNYLWIANFLLAGSANLFVAYQFSEAAWVSYKLWSMIGFTLVLSLLTALIISPHVKDEQLKDDQQSSV